jgi:hypothetical protein
VVLLLCLRTEKVCGYPFPREIKHRLIREALAAPDVAFLGSLLSSEQRAGLFDKRETVSDEEMKR